MSASDKLRILLVDDHKLFRKGLISLLASCCELQVVGEAENGEQALAATRTLLPDLVLLDVHMPGGDGIAAVKAIKREMPQIKIVMLSAFDDDDDLFLAIKSGANGYLLKNIDPEQLCLHLKGIRQGEAAISGVLADRILAELRKDPVVAEPPPCAEGEVLTEKETKTLELLVQGLGNKEIADVLRISENTVTLHLRNIMEKLHLQNRTQIAVYAVRRQLVPPPEGSSG